MSFRQDPFDFFRAFLTQQQPPTSSAAQLDLLDQLIDLFKLDLQQKQSPDTGMILGIVAIVAIVVVGAIVAFYWLAKDQPAAERKSVEFQEQLMERLDILEDELRRLRQKIE